MLLSTRWKYRTKPDRTWSTLLYLVENKLTSKFRFEDSTWSDVDVHETRVRQRLNAEDRSRIVRSNVDQQFFLPDWNRWLWLNVSTFTQSLTYAHCVYCNLGFANVFRVVSCFLCSSIVSLNYSFVYFLLQRDRDCSGTLQK